MPIPLNINDVPRLMARGNVSQARRLELVSNANKFKNKETTMRTYASLKAALNDMPNCLVATSCDDLVGIECQAKRDAENPRPVFHGRRGYGDRQHQQGDRYEKGVCPVSPLRR